jgi:hypothetical protein
MFRCTSFCLLALRASSVSAIDPAYAVNITIYHVNAATYGAAPVNMNTGDALGDMYFDLRSVDIALECAHPSASTAHDCDNQEVVATDLAITKLVLEVDSRYGGYGRCNVCVNGTDHHVSFSSNLVSLSSSASHSCIGIIISWSSD